MREKGLLPCLVAQTYIIHEGYPYTDEIVESQTYVDFGNFINRYITRLLGEKLSAVNAYIDSYANLLLYSIENIQST